MLETVRKYGICFLMMTMTSGILTELFVTGFSVKVFQPALVTGILAFSLFFCWFYLCRALDGKRIPVFCGIGAGWAALGILMQQTIQDSLLHVADDVILSMNKVYQSGIRPLGSGGGTGETGFLLLILFWIAAVLGAGILPKVRMLYLAAILFPFVALLFLLGGRPEEIWLFALVLLIPVLKTASSTKLPHWKGAGAVCVLILVLSVPAWYLAEPLLQAPETSLSKVKRSVETKALGLLHKAAPAFSGGKLELSMEEAAGGVGSGDLKEAEGYFVAGVDDLEVTSLQKPEETLYLRGYIGGEYTGTSFLERDGEAFLDSSQSWKTEGNPSVYMWNLPFLRMMYYENFREGNPSGTLESSANTITVKKLEANGAYTYAPAVSFLNDYYRIQGGDGSVEGQSVQDDIFSCYWQKDYQKMMEAFRDGKDRGGVLDQAEASYRAFCVSRDTVLPEKGLDRLKKQCRNKMKEEKWDSSLWTADVPDWQIADQISEIRSYVVKTLLENCSYEENCEPLPEGEDFVEYFLYESREGYSMHFAAAATEMFRAFGVPARYVTGYAASPEMFTEQSGQGWKAVIQDDSAHAWTEIYIPFMGWTPVEVTPGRETEMKETTEENIPERQEKQKRKDSGQENNNAAGHLVKWFTGNLREVIVILQIVILCAAVVCAVVLIRKFRRERYGAGLEPEEQIKVLYRRFYQKLVKKGMPPEFSLDGEKKGQFRAYLRERFPEITEEDLRHLEKLVLQIHYSPEKAEKQDVRWMKNMYGKLKKSRR